MCQISSARGSFNSNLILTNFKNEIFVSVCLETCIVSWTATAQTHAANLYLPSGYYFEASGSESVGKERG